MKGLVGLVMLATAGASAQVPSRWETNEAFRREQEEHRQRGTAAQTAASLRAAAFAALEQCIRRDRQAGLQAIPGMPDLCRAAFEADMRLAEERVRQ